MSRLSLRLGSASLSCVVAETPSEHALGLQKHSSLADGEGMFFLFERPRSPTFHMGDVRFPIDLMGVGADSRITKIVEDARPGSSERWMFHRVSAVIEVPAGWCLRNGVKVGTLVEDVSDVVLAPHARREAALGVGGGLRLKDIARVSIGDPNADFWVTRRGSEETVGKPTHSFNPEAFAVTITDTERFPSNFVYYMIQWLWSSGYFKPLARGSLRLVGIRKQDLEDVVVNNDTVAHIPDEMLPPGMIDEEGFVSLDAPEGHREAHSRYAQPDIQQRMIREREEEKGGDQQYRDRLMPDDIVNTSAFHDEPKEEYWKDLLGEELTDVALQPDVDSPVMRRGHKTAQIVDEQKFVQKMSNIIFAHFDEVEWTPTPLNAGATERTVVNRAVLNRWLKTSGANDDGARYILTAAGTEQGLSLIGDAFVLSGLADQANVGWGNKEPILVLYRENERGFELSGAADDIHKQAVEVDITPSEGVDPSAAKRMVDKFQQLNSKMTTPYRGIRHAAEVYDLTVELLNYLKQRGDKTIADPLLGELSKYRSDAFELKTMRARIDTEPEYADLISMRTGLDPKEFLMAAESESVYALLEALKTATSSLSSSDVLEEPRRAREIMISGVPFEIEFRGASSNIEVPVEAYREALNLIRRAGFDKALDGVKVVVTSYFGLYDDTGLGGVYARGPVPEIARAGDVVYILTSASTPLETLVHELGHRYYFKYMPSNAIEHWEGVMGSEVLTANIVDPLVLSIVKGAKEYEKRTGKKYKIDFESAQPLVNKFLEEMKEIVNKEDQAEHLRKNPGAPPLPPKDYTKQELELSGRRYKQFMEQLAKETGRTSWNGVDQFIRSVQGMSFSVDHYEPISAYATTKPVEAFAEAFRRYVVEGPRALGPRTRAFFEKLTHLNRRAYADRQGFDLEAGFDIEAGRKDDAWAFVEAQLEGSDEDTKEATRKTFDVLVSSDPSGSKLKYLGWMVREVFYQTRVSSMEPDRPLNNDDVQEFAGRVNAVTVVVKEWEKSLTRIPPEKRNINNLSLDEAQAVLVDIVQEGKRRAIREKADTVISNVIAAGGAPIWRSPDKRVLLIRIPTQAAAYASAQTQHPPFPKPAWCIGQYKSSYWRHYRKCKDSRFYLIIDRDTMQRTMLQESGEDGRIFWDEEDRSSGSFEPAFEPYADEIGDAVDADASKYPAWLNQAEDEEFERDNYGDCADHDHDLDQRPEWYRDDDWEDRGFDVDEAEPWYNEGFNAEDAAAWSGAEFDADDAATWNIEAFNGAPRRARAYVDAGFDDPDVANEWYDVAYSNGFKAKFAYKLSEVGYSPEEAGEAYSSGWIATNDDTAMLEAVYSVMYGPDKHWQYSKDVRAHLREWLTSVGDEITGYQSQAFVMLESEVKRVDVDALADQIEGVDAEISALAISMRDAPGGLPGPGTNFTATGVRLVIEDALHADSANKDDLEASVRSSLSRFEALFRNETTADGFEPEDKLRSTLGYLRSDVGAFKYLALNEIEKLVQEGISHNTYYVAKNQVASPDLPTLKLLKQIQELLMQELQVGEGPGPWRDFIVYGTPPAMAEAAYFVRDLKTKGLSSEDIYPWFAAGYRDAEEVIDQIDAGRTTPDAAQPFEDVFTTNPQTRKSTVLEAARRLHGIIMNSPQLTRAFGVDLNALAEINNGQFRTKRQAYKRLVEVLAPAFDRSAVDYLIGIGEHNKNQFFEYLEFAGSIKEVTGELITGTTLESLGPVTRYAPYSGPSNYSGTSLATQDLMRQCAQLGMGNDEIAATISAWARVDYRPAVATVALRLGILRPDNPLFDTLKGAIGAVVTSLDREEAFNALYRRLHGAGLLSESLSAPEGEPEPLVGGDEGGHKALGYPQIVVKQSPPASGLWAVVRYDDSGNGMGLDDNLNRDEALRQGVAMSDGTPVYMEQEGGGYRRIASLRESVRFFGLK